MDYKEKQRRKYFTGVASEYYLKTGNSLYQHKRVKEARKQIKRMKKDLDTDLIKMIGDDISEENIIFI